MIIQVPESAPLAVKAAAAGLLYLHIGGAVIGLGSGTVSMLARKGQRLHRQAGLLFVGAMVAMGGAGAVTAPFIPDRLSALMGAFVCYLAVTAWVAVKRPPGRAGGFELGAFAAGLALAAAYFGLAAVAVNGKIDGLPAQLAVVAGSIALLAAVTDLKAIRQGSLSAPARLRRHIWRISLALFITWGSFAGQPVAQPEAIRGSGLLFLPALAVLVLMAWWLFRHRDRRREAKPALA